MGGSGVVPYAHLGVGMVSSLHSSSSSSSPISSHFPSSSLAWSLGTGGDLRKLAPMGGPQVRLGASTVEEQEVHTGWTTLTYSCEERGGEGWRAQWGRIWCCHIQTVSHHLQFPLQGKRLISCSLVSDLLMGLSFGCRRVPCCHKQDRLTRAKKTCRHMNVCLFKIMEGEGERTGEGRGRKL